MICVCVCIYIHIYIYCICFSTGAVSGSGFDPRGFACTWCLWCVLRRLTGGLAGFLLFFVSVLVPPLLLGLFLALCAPGGFLRLQALLIGQEVFCLLRGLLLLLRDPFLLEALRALVGSFLFLQPLPQTVSAGAVCARLLRFVAASLEEVCHIGSHGRVTRGTLCRQRVHQHPRSFWQRDCGTLFGPAGHE